MKWFEYDQNNSGGGFDVDDNVCHRLFIQAENVESADAKAESLGVYFNGVDDGIDCDCCGDRWYSPWKEENFPINVKGNLLGVEEYAQYLANEYGWTKPDARIFYHDGTVKEIFSQDRSKFH